MDAETYFDDSMTLSKMSTEAYCRDEKFECHGWAIKWSENHNPKFYTHKECLHIFKEEDWCDTAVLAHHAAFDGLILSDHYGIRPAFWFDTLSCARLLIGNHLSVGLDALAKQFGLAAKTVPYQLFKGRRWGELSEAVQQQVADGACHDVALTWELFKKLGPQMPMEEFETINLTIKMFTEPVLRANIDSLAQVWEREASQKEARLQALAIDVKELQSADKFIKLLEAEGVEIEYKDGKNGPIPALAKTDSFLRGLLEDENDRVRGLAEARIGAKSTLMQTRAETLGFMATRGSGRSAGTLPVYLRYCGAHTTRWSGGDGCLVADTKILVFEWKKGLTKKNIVDIQPDDLVWDGVEFVAHAGVEFCGFQEVIDYDGLEGTKDHIVFTSDNRELTLEKAHSEKARLMDCPEPSDRALDVARKTSRY